MKGKLIAQALTIAGFDGGGGAGMQADLKVFQERRVFGTSVLTALPIQNTKGVSNIFPIPLQAIEEQLASIQDDFIISAVKTGMLFTTEIVQLVADVIKKANMGPLVVDPVMVAKSGQPLLKESAIQALIQELLPSAFIITPNIPEAEIITKKQIKTKDEMIEAGKRIQALGVPNVIIKGGHHNSERTVSSDLVLFADREIQWLTTPRITTKNTHGTGCTFSACITAELAKRQELSKAIQTSKAFIQAAIEDGIIVGSGHGPTNHWAYRNVEKR